MLLAKRFPQQTCPPLLALKKIESLEWNGRIKGLKSKQLNKRLPLPNTFTPSWEGWAGEGDGDGDNRDQNGICIKDAVFNFRPSPLIPVAILLAVSRTSARWGLFC